MVTIKGPIKLGKGLPVPKELKELVKKNLGLKEVKKTKK